MSDRDKTREILDALKARCDHKDIWCEELALSDGARRCDFWVLSPWNSKGYKAVAYEIKVSRADFRRETHKKQREARLYSDQFYYVAPKGMIKPEEVPDWAGLMEFDSDEESHWKRLRFAVPAPERGKDTPSWSLVVGIIRNSGEARRDMDVLKSENARLKNQVKQLSEWRRQ